MIIRCQFPQSYEAERSYAAETIFSRFLGLDISIDFVNRIDSQVTVGGSNKRLLLLDELFATPSNYWLKTDSLPSQPLPVWDFGSIRSFIFSSFSSIPIIYGKEVKCNDFLQISDQQILLGLDILGSAFFMLTRYEEKAKQNRDKFDRFPASSSLAYQEDFLHRPIINEYVEILWICLKKLWPTLKRKSRQFQIRVSHDVDMPYQYAFTGRKLLARNVIGDIVKRRNIPQGSSRVKTWRQVKSGNLAADPFNNFDWIMALSEAQNITSAFYFITAHTCVQRDGNYDIRHPFIRELLRSIHQRGHEVGLHPSFNTYLDARQICQEFDLLREVCREEGIHQESYGGRQHFLRWQTPHTFQNWNDAGLSYDSTLTYADQAGFRCGTCYEYPTFNLLTRQKLKLIERPLIAMECTVLDKRYMGLEKNIEQAYAYLSQLKTHCRFFNGDFTLLWHNHRFANPIECELYQQILAA